MKVLVSCPPMIGMLDHFAPRFAGLGWSVDAPKIVQTLSEPELIELLPGYDGWIIGDDPATRAVLAAGCAGRLRACVKWGVGVDNVDFEAARELGIPAVNTPRMFGAEVADVALGYLIGLARGLFGIDRAVREGGWSKPAGRSLAGSTAALVGFGDIGRALARRLLALDMRVRVYDPRYAPAAGLEAVESRVWPEGIEEADAILLACALTPSSRRLLDAEVFGRLERAPWLVNVSRGGLVDEAALCDALESGRVGAAALDVFECEPLPADARLRRYADRVVFGSHNASNTREAVVRASERAIDALAGFLRP